MSEPSQRKQDRIPSADDQAMQAYRKQRGLKPGYGPPRKEETEVSDGRRNPR